MRIGTVIVGILLLIFCLWIFNYRLAKSLRKNVYAKGVHPDFHQDLEKKILELKHESGMSDKEWEEFLKISQYADDLYEKTHPWGGPFGRLTDLVRRILHLKKNPPEAGK